MLRLRLNRRLDLWSSRRRSSRFDEIDTEPILAGVSSNLFVMSSESRDISCCSSAKKVRDSSTALGMTTKALFADESALWWPLSPLCVSAIAKTGYEQN